MRHALTLLAFTLATPAFAADPTPIIHHAGRLLDGSDNPITSQVTLTITLFDSKDGAPQTSAWTETYTVSPLNGVYDVALGDPGSEGTKRTLAPADVAGARWVGIKVNGEPLLPRLALGIVPLALRTAGADNADALGGVAAAQYALKTEAAPDSAKLGGKTLTELQSLFAPASGGTGYVNLQVSSPAAQTGAIAVTGTVTASKFLGELPASALTGTLAESLFPSTLANAYTFSSAASTFKGTFNGAFTGAITGTGAFAGSVQITAASSAPAACGSSGAATGSLYFDTTQGAMQVCAGSTWSAVGSKPAQLAWNPTNLDFGTVTTAPVNKPATLTNVGSQSASGIFVTAPAGFSVDASGCPATLAPNGNCTVIATMSPQGASGARTGGLTAGFASGGSGATLPLGGTAAQPGGSQTSPALSCKAIKTAYNAATDGPYWLKPDGPGGSNPALQAYCDMTTDGGGWTFFAHVASNYVAGQLFATNIGSYRTDRGTGSTYSGAGSFNAYIPHKQMMVTLDGTDVGAARASNKLLFYQYAVGQAAFSTGPVPCTGLAAGFQYRFDWAGAFASGGTSNSCDSGSWYSRTAGNASYLVLFNSGSTYGNYWGEGFSGSSGTWNHDGYWYIRE